MQDSIIVYRNPLEKAVWEHMGSIALFAIVMLVTFLVTYHICDCLYAKYLNKYTKGCNWTLWVASIVSITCGILALIYNPF